MVAFSIYIWKEGEMKKVLGIIVVLVLVLAGCSSDADPLADGVLTVGMEADYAPYNWTTTADKGSENAIQISGNNSYADGYDVMVAQAIADELGVELEIKKIAWDGLIPALQSNDIDVIIAGMSPTAERKEQINFTDAYFEDESKQQIIVGANSSFVGATSLADLKGANLTAQMGTFQVDLLSQIEISESAQSPLPDYASLMQAAKAGTIDGYIAEQQVADAQIKENSDLVQLELTDGLVVSADQTSTSIGVRKADTDLTEQINAALAKIDSTTRNEWMESAKSLSDTE